MFRVCSQIMSQVLKVLVFLNIFTLISMICPYAARAAWWLYIICPKSLLFGTNQPKRAYSRACMDILGMQGMI